ncbi:MAG TPA: DUF4870 domain-containing protein [Roseiflexaceae bacterium]|jgi:uncharacterized Tic20 family protein
MQPTEDERVLAALSHASIVANIFNLAGMIATALIWTMQRERSRYVRAHALQSLVYQGMVLMISVFLILFWGLCIVLSLLPVYLKPELYHISSPPRSFWFALVGLVVPLGFAIAATVYGLYGAYRVYRGRRFRYPLAGRLVRRDLVATNQPPPPLAAPSVGIPPAVETPAPLTDEVSPVATPAGDGETTPTSAAELPTARRRGRRKPPGGQE